MKKQISTVLSVIGLLISALTFAAPANASTQNTHVIEKGDTFWVLAQDYNVPLDDILALNPDEDVYNLQVGSTIMLPGTTTATATPIKTIPTSTVTSTSVWDEIAECESGGDWSLNDGSHSAVSGQYFYGGLQFTLSSWAAVGGTGYPHEASKAEQIARAEALQALQGWGAWPVCSARAGLR